MKPRLVIEFSNLSMSYQVRDVFEFHRKSIFKAEGFGLAAGTRPPDTPSAPRTVSASL